MEFSEESEEFKLSEVINLVKENPENVENLESTTEVIQEPVKNKVNNPEETPTLTEELTASLSKITLPEKKRRRRRRRPKKKKPLVFEIPSEKMPKIRKRFSHQHQKPAVKNFHVRFDDSGNPDIEIHFKRKVPEREVPKTRIIKALDQNLACNEDFKNPKEVFINEIVSVFSNSLAGNPVDPPEVIEILKPRIIKAIVV